ALVDGRRPHSAGLETRGHHAVPAHGEEVLMSTATATLDPAADALPAVEAFTVTLIVRRYDPDVDSEPRWEDFDVEMYSTDRVLDALHRIKWDQDGTLTFRRSCAHGICGSDAM